MHLRREAAGKLAPRQLGDSRIDAREEGRRQEAEEEEFAEAHIELREVHQRLRAARGENRVQSAPRKQADR